MKIIPLVQGSDDWHQYRRSRIMASDAPVIMGASPYRHKTPRNLFFEKTADLRMPDTPAMERGRLLEAEARYWFCREWDLIDCPAMVVEHPELSWHASSLDGFCDGFQIEIKCLKLETLDRIKQGDIPLDILYQMQHQMFDTGMQMAFLIGYHEKLRFWVEVPRDQKMMDELLLEETKFFRSLDLKEPPLPTDRDYEIREDEEWMTLAAERIKTKNLINELEDLLASQDDALIMMSGERSCRGGGISVTLCAGKRTTDYKRIPELKALDLTPYQKVGQPYWTVRNSED